MLAAQLKEGSPCPVCGSLSHPKKAVLFGESARSATSGTGEKKRDLAEENDRRYMKHSGSEKPSGSRRVAARRRKGRGSDQEPSHRVEAGTKRCREAVEQAEKSWQQLKGRESQKGRDTGADKAKRRADDTSGGRRKCV